jgi:hypothetical protein
VLVNNAGIIRDSTLHKMSPENWSAVVSTNLDSLFNISRNVIKDGLWCAFNGYHMGTTAENVAKKWQLTRDEQDAFAAASQQKAEAAQNEASSKRRSFPSPSRPARAKSLWIPTSIPSTARRQRVWRSCAPPSTKREQ